MRIELKSLCKSYGSLKVLDQISLEIQAGQVAALLGCNGAGKTTLLRCMAGIVAAHSGEILYAGERFHRDRIDLRRRFYFLPDMPFMFPNASALSHRRVLPDGVIAPWQSIPVSKGRATPPA